MHWTSIISCDVVLHLLSFAVVLETFTLLGVFEFFISFIDLFLQSSEVGATSQLYVRLLERAEYQLMLFFISSRTFKLTEYPATSNITTSFIIVCMHELNLIVFCVMSF